MINQMILSLDFRKLASIEPPLTPMSSTPSSQIYANLISKQETIQMHP